MTYPFASVVEASRPGYAQGLANSGCASLALSLAEPASKAAIKAETHLSDRICSKAARNEVVLAARRSNRLHD